METCYIIVKDDLIDEDAAKVDDRRDNASVLRASEHGLEEDDLTKDSLTVQPEEDPKIHGLRVVDHGGQQHGPRKSRHHCVDYRIVHEP